MAAKPVPQYQSANEIVAIKPAAAPAAIKTNPNGTTENVAILHRHVQPSGGEQPLYWCKTQAGVYAYIPENLLTPTGSIVTL